MIAFVQFGTGENESGCDNPAVATMNPELVDRQTSTLGLAAGRVSPRFPRDNRTLTRGG
jgi:hypothetical protein